MTDKHRLVGLTQVLEACPRFLSVELQADHIPVEKSNENKAQMEIIKFHENDI